LLCCRYVDKWRYLESGQEKKKGFLTSDFSKRDEFSNTVRTLQWREQLSVSRASRGVSCGLLGGECAGALVRIL
jgi:hypothetical protein